MSVVFGFIKLFMIFKYKSPTVDRLRTECLGWSMKLKKFVWPKFRHSTDIQEVSVFGTVYLIRVVKFSSQFMLSYFLFFLQVIFEIRLKYCSDKTVCKTNDKNNFGEHYNNWNISSYSFRNCYWPLKKGKIFDQAENSAIIIYLCL